MNAGADYCLICAGPYVNSVSDAEFEWLESSYVITKNNDLYRTKIVHLGKTSANGKEFRITPGSWDRTKKEVGIACHRNCYKLLVKKMAYELKFSDVSKLLSRSIHCVLDDIEPYGKMCDYAFWGEFKSKCFTENKYLVSDPLSNNKNQARILKTWTPIVNKIKLKNKNRCILDDYIDFEELLKMDCIDNDQTIFTGPMIADREHFIDEEISTSTGKKILKNFDLDQLSKFKHFIPDTDRDINTTVFYKSPTNDYLFYMDADGDSSLQIFGLVNHSDAEYIFLGCDGSHPFIMTKYFLYGNSDGSGPDFEDELADNYSAKNIFKLMKKYHREFCNNDYH